MVSFKLTTVRDWGFPIGEYIRADVITLFMLLPQEESLKAYKDNNTLKAIDRTL